MSKNNSSLKDVIWAVDAFEAPDETLPAAVNALRALSGAGEPSVRPVYVLSPEQMDMTTNFDERWVTRYRPAALKSVKAMVRQAASKGVPNLKEPQVVSHMRPSLSSSARALDQLARSSGAGLIVLGTHARKGAPRLFMGSFAETMLLHAKTPLLIVNPAQKSSPVIRRILHPTDLKRSSHAAFGKVLELAAELGAEVTILHAIPHPIEPVVQSGAYLLGGGWISVPHYLQEEEARRRKSAEAWVRKAASLGVKASVVIDADSEGVLQAIENTLASEPADLIAMGAKSGPLKSALLGSITRQVVRAALRPVWVCRV